MIAAAPYALHSLPDRSSAAGSHASASLRASAVMGTFWKSPFGGVIIRKRQSSVTNATQYPVKSIGADCLAAVAGGAAERFCPETHCEPRNIANAAKQVIIRVR